MPKLQLILVLVFAVSQYFPALATSDSLRILTTEEPPMNFTDKGAVTGLITDIVKDLARRTQTASAIRSLPWARAYHYGLKEPNVVLFTAARTEAREKLFHWVGPVISKRWVLYKKKGASIPVLKTPEDIRRAGSVVVMHGDAREQLLSDWGVTRLARVTEHLQGLRMLLAGRVALFASSDIEGPLLVEQAKTTMDQLEQAYVLKEIRSYIMISKKTPMPIVKAWQEAFEEAEKDRTLIRIAAHWSKKLNMPLTARNGVIESLRHSNISP